MKYGLILWPHANARYFAGMLKLAVSETNILLRYAKIEAHAETETVSGMSLVTFECGGLTAEQLSVIGSHSLLYWLVRFDDNGAFVPVLGRNAAYLGDDLPLVLKYKGKTNEFFSAYLMNMAVCCGEYVPGGTISVLDPMCSRCTTPFLAVNRGWNTTGIEIDRNDIHEADTYFKRYLEYHRFKYTRKDTSLTIAGRKPVAGHVYTVSDTPDNFKKGDTRVLTMLIGDATEACAALKKESFHAVTADLPYGVQHAPGGGTTLEGLVKKLAASVRPVIKKGGCIALSYNDNTLPKKTVDGILTAAGYTVLTGEDFDDLSHWVEQAVTRNITVARK